VGLTHGLTILIAVIIAYAARGGAGPMAASHYTWLIRTFWLAIGFFLAGAAIAFWGGVLSLILIGVPFLFLGLAIMGAVWIWVLVRCILGVVRLADGRPMPNPYSLFV
jgi:uncharacterized membrane protein